MSKICSFCGRAEDKVKAMVTGPRVFICNYCVDSCNEILQENVPVEPTQVITQLKFNQTPAKLHAFLDEYVIGQEKAKKVLSVAVYNHYKRLRNSHNPDNDVELEKSNILMFGPTGSGKTLLAKTIARILDVPFTIADATTLTEAGYVGDDVENVIKSLLSKCNYDAERAQTGIIFLDEIDKLSRKSDSASITRDVSGEGVQQAMLKLIEGTIAHVPAQGGRKHPEKPTIDVDTSKILFICGGAFDGLEKIIKRRITTGTSIGFATPIKNNTHSTNITDLLAHVEPDDLVRYGLIPELVGRLSVHINLEELDEEALITILTQPKNAIIKQFAQFFALEGVKLTTTKPALCAIAKLAIKRKTGARGLRSIVENILLDTMYELPSRNDVTEVIVTKASVTNHTKIKLITT